MTGYHSKRGPVDGCPQPDEPIRERAWTAEQMAAKDAAQVDEPGESDEQ